MIRGFREARLPFLRKLYNGWMRFARALGYVNTRILLFLVFILVLGPVGVLGRLFGKNFYEEPKKNAESYWHVRPEPAYSKESLLQQF